MVDNFRIREISQGARKLVRTPTLINKKVLHFIPLKKTLKKELKNKYIQIGINNSQFNTNV
jgi:hypothetical protein